MEMQPTDLFEPHTVALLQEVLSEIEAEFAAKGEALNEASRQEFAQRIMTIASRGETDRAVIKRYAFGDVPLIDTL